MSELPPEIFATINPLFQDNKFEEINTLISDDEHRKEIFKLACLGGEKDIVDLCLHKQNDLSEGLKYASQGGHVDLVNLISWKRFDNLMSEKTSLDKEYETLTSGDPLVFLVNKTSDIWDWAHRKIRFIINTD